MGVIGVLALQGAVSEHQSVLRDIGFDSKAVKRTEDLQDLCGLILPGGESTAISRLIRTKGLSDPIRDFARTKPVLGTCAGLVLCATEVAGTGGSLPGEMHSTMESGQAKVVPLELLDIRVQRNAFGRQIQSFETELDVTGIGTNIPAIFIRAPCIDRVGNGVQVMARVDGKIVMARKGTVTVTAFHPELAGDRRIFQYVFGRTTERVLTASLRG